MITEYSIPMALEDFLPVAFSACGFWLIAGTLTRRDAVIGRLAWSGVILIVLGGFLKAAWKLIIAATGNDILWMRESLFILLGPGFVMLSLALWRGLKGRSLTAGQIWGPPMLISLLALAVAAWLGMKPSGRVWSLWLLMIATLGNVWTSGQLIRDSWRRHLRVAGVLFLYNILTIFLQARLARMEQTTMLQWVEQLNNTMSWGAFAMGAWLWRAPQDV